MLSQALIIPGGLGGRAARWLDNGATELLELVLWNLHRHGITEVLFAPEPGGAIFSRLGDGSRYGVRLTWLEEMEDPGLAAGLRLAGGLLDDSFLVIDATIFFDCNYLDLCLHRSRSGTLAALALGTQRQATGAAVRLLGGRVAGFGRADGEGPHLVSGGLAVMSQAVLDRIGPREAAGASLLASLAIEGELEGVVYPGSPREAVIANREAPATWRRRPAVFFDRDGVLNVDHGFVGTPERWEWMPGAPQAVKRCNDLGYLVIVVTNQSGIGRGYFTEKAFTRLMAWANEYLRDQGAHFDAVYACPHHPTAGLGAYRRDCACRKPKPGLFDQAFAAWDVDVAHSVAVGDNQRDLDAATARGIPGKLFPGGNLLEFMEFLPAGGKRGRMPPAAGRD